MKVAIPGGTGQVGTILARAFHRDGHDVVVLTRRVKPAAPVHRSSSEGGCRVVEWDPRQRGAWAAAIDGADVVINLAGRSVNCRYNAANRREILESRTMSVRAVAEAIAAAKQPPRVWLQASTATIYAHRYDVPNDEATGILGGAERAVPETWRFSIDVATAWEKALDDTVTPRTRKIKLRTAMVMSPDAGGIFATLLMLVRRGLGGAAGDGRQYISWIHEVDFVRAVKLLIAHDLDGPVNLSSPNPLPNREFMAVLRRAWGMPIGLPAAKWMLEIGAATVMQTETELVLKSRRVVPGRLLQAGFTFSYPEWPQAARELCDRVRQNRHR